MARSPYAGSLKSSRCSRKSEHKIAVASRDRDSAEIPRSATRGTAAESRPAALTPLVIADETVRRDGSRSRRYVGPVGVVVIVRGVHHGAVRDRDRVPRVHESHDAVRHLDVHDHYNMRLIPPVLAGGVRPPRTGGAAVPESDPFTGAGRFVIAYSRIGKSDIRKVCRYRSASYRGIVYLLLQRSDSRARAAV